MEKTEKPANTENGSTYPVIHVYLMENYHDNLSPYSQANPAGEL